MRRRLDVQVSEPLRNRPSDSQLQMLLSGELLPPQGAQSQHPPPAMLPSSHPATLALMRSKLEILATDQFRLDGRSMPGAKLGWLIERDGGQHADHDAAPEQQSWHTRLSLSLLAGTIRLKTGDPQKVVANYAPRSILLPTVSNKPRVSVDEKLDYFKHFLESKPDGTIDFRKIIIECNTAIDAGTYTYKFGDG